ncbi:MAG: hypothetical protein GEU99_24330 [Luteitalea sp.]|nr:hypothetical protein [Luteitalea sp.]
MRVFCLLALSCSLLIDHRAEMAPITQTTSEDDPCAEVGGWGDDDYSRHCETREETLPAGPLAVGGGQNGGIRVEGWDQHEIRVQVVVLAHARSEDRAGELASQVQVETAGNRVHANGPATSGREWWSVSYRINLGAGGAPVRVRTTNGGVRIEKR